MGSARPVRRFNAHRAHSRQAFRRPKPPEALLALSRPFRGPPPQPRKPPPARRPACRNLLPLLGSSSLRHTLGAVIPLLARGSRRERVPRPGFGYPHRGVHHRPYRRAKRRSALGLLPSRPSPRRGRRPSRRPCPPGVAGRASHRGVRRDAADFRALISRRARSAPDPEGSDRRCLPGIHPSRAFPPSVRACALVALPALPPIRRGDVPARPGLRASRSGWIGLVRLRTADSPGVLHLPTVTALRSPGRGAGS
jgi:hypothetical protein